MSTSSRLWPHLLTEHAWLPAHDRPTTTRPLQVGVAFTGHRGVVYETGGRTVRADHAPGAAIVSGPQTVTWLRVGEPVEALEMYPDPALVAATTAARSSRPADIVPHVGVTDGTVVAIASLLRRSHTTGPTDHTPQPAGPATGPADHATGPAGLTRLTDVAASALAHRLVDHLLDRYAGLPDPDRKVRAGRLDGVAVDRVAEFVDARMGAPLALDDLAAVVRLSPFHFHRCFRATTGLAPHAFVTARRMDRARLLVSTTSRTVDEIAESVGFTNVSHFRRMFRRHHGLAPSALRSATEMRKIGPDRSAAARADWTPCPCKTPC